jgi:hypothetical protein
MRLAALGAVCAVLGIATAQAAWVERVQVLRAGLWLPGDGGRPVFARATEFIPAKVGTLFGIEWRPTGRASDGNPSLKIRWLYPAPGLQHPVTRARRTLDEFDYTVTPGARETTLIELNSEAMLLPGKWTVEIGDASRVLARREFSVTP